MMYVIRVLMDQSDDEEMLAMIFDLERGLDAQQQYEYVDGCSTILEPMTPEEWHQIPVD